eukprot:14630238-Alexandrium_andersonii.AAC.1
MPSGGPAEVRANARARPRAPEAMEAHWRRAQTHARPHAPERRMGSQCGHTQLPTRVRSDGGSSEARANARAHPHAPERRMGAQCGHAQLLEANLAWASERDPQ